MSFASNVLALAPSLYWKLDEPGAANAANPADPWAYLAPGTTEQTPAIADGGYSISASGTHAIARYPSVPGALAGASVSVDMWVYIPATNVKGAFFTNTSSLSNGWGVGVGATDWSGAGKQLILVQPGVAWHQTSHTLATGWRHIAVTRSAANLFTAYVDGSSVWSATFTPSAPTGTMQVGGYDAPGSFALSSTCRVDNFAIYPSVLSSTRVGVHAAATTTYSTEVLADLPHSYLKFDETAAEVATNPQDSSGSARHGTNAGVVSLGRTSLLGDGSGKSATYDGSTGYSAIASASWMNAACVSVVIRVKPDSGMLSGSQPIASRWIGSAGNSQWLLWLNAGKPEAYIRTAAAQNNTASATALTAGAEYTLGFTYDGTTIRLYVNGSQVASQAQTGALQSITGPIELSRVSSSVYGRGNLDEFAVFYAASSVLSAGDMLALHNAAVSVGSVDFTPPEATASSAAPAPSFAIPFAFTIPKATATAAAIAAVLTIGAAPLPLAPPEATATSAAPAPALVIGPFGFTPPAPTANGAAPAPALAFGAFEVAAPKATATSAAPTPSLNVAGSPLELAIPAAPATAAAPAPVLAIPVVGRPWTADLSRRTIMPFVTSGHATSSPPLPAVPPGIVERVMWRRSKVVPDLRTIEGVVVDPTTNQLRIPDDIYDSLPETIEEMGVPHVLFRGATTSVRDITYWRGGITKILSDRREEPFGDATFSFELPLVSSMDLWPVEDDDPLFFMINRANVYLELVKSDGSRRPLWTGHVVAHRTGNSETSPSKVIQCVGSMFQAATDRMRPPPFLDPTDIGTLMSKALNGVTSRRYPLLGAPATGIMSRQKGSWAESPLAYVQGLLATAWTEDGRQWTVAKVKDSVRTYEIRTKKTAAEWTITNGARGVSVDLTRDESTIRNVIYGHGVGPDGSAWFNTHYPNLRLTSPPAFPYSDPDAVMTVGTTDADTDSGDGVTVWQQRARDLGYKVPLDAVFNTSDAAVARTIQRRYGISVDGVVGGQTWTAMFVTGANSGDLSGVVRLPLAADPRTQRWLYNADGSIAGPNPMFEVNVITYADDVDFGTGITRAEGIASAQQIIDREAVAGLTGTIVLTQDPREGWRGDIAPGDKITLIGYEGADHVLHVTAPERGWADPKFPVTLQVDEKSRDALTVAQIRARDKEARRDPARRPGNPNKRSRLDVDQVVPFDGESGAGIIPRHPINGGLWNVYPLPVSELGRVAEMRIKCTAPFAMVLLGAPTTAAHMAAWVGNPFLSDNPLQAHERELDAHWLIDGWGQKGQRCGYYPGAEDQDDPFTGVEEMSGFEFASSRGPWIWVAEFAETSCFIEGYIKPDAVI